MKSSHFPTSIIASLSLSLLSTAIADARPVNYSFTEVASTRGNFKALNNPVINNLGIVAFEGELDAGGKGIFSSNGTVTNTIAKTSQNFSSISSNIAINDFGIVAFIADKNIGLPYTTGVYASNGRSLKPIQTVATTDENGLGIQSDSFRAVSINNLGIVALLQIGARQGEFIFTSDGTTTHQIAVTDDFIPSIQINDLSTVAYSKINLGVYVGDGNITTAIDEEPIIDGKTSYLFTNSSINNKDSVAYVKKSAEKVSGSIAEILAVKKGNKTTIIADSNGSFNSFSSPSINDRDTVAFLANLDTGGKGIFIANNRKIERAIATGDSLFGYTVVDLSFTPDGQNNLGQITFVAKLANNTEAIVLANPNRKFVR